ncbi:MAG: photosynthesis system II assembly factor Ycf48 [Pseudanabaenaceae cyanobacterium]
MRWISAFLAVVLSFVLNLPAYGEMQGTWKLVRLPSPDTPIDMTFSDQDPNHGWIVGTNASLLETFDGGKTWRARALDLGDINYRFVSVSFYGNEGWIVGKPALLLHSTDAGKTWTRIGLSSKLPGDPALIVALAPGTAEMATDIGAIYKTTDTAQHWRALVTQAVGTVRNLYRNRDGRYIAVSAKGNFYSTWAPGESSWTQHNRNNSKRVNNMGYTPDGRVWMLNRGGQLQFTKSSNLEEWEKPQAPKVAEGYGLLDLFFQDDRHVWVTGGASHLLYSEDGGHNWERVYFPEKVGANLYRIYFFGDRGFILGQAGVLLRYEPRQAQVN